ncbi:hypothetical protein [Sorangium sp. So ce861]|uniref:hypothetical protein n=1 Tax=Sorangium sp. So ce861 TaxID=3133323 RepID=UPI003F6157EA
MACSEDDPGAGGAGGAGGEETGGGGAGGEETGGGGAGGEETGGGGAGGEASCDDVLDDEALEEPVAIVVTNERSTPVYLTPGGCSPVGWSVDGKSMFEAAIPTCEGLHAGEPGGPACAPSFEELAAGASVTVEWHGRIAETVPVVDSCVAPSISAEHETCGRLALAGDGAHELELTVYLELDEESEIGTSPLPTITVPFTLPTESIAVTIPAEDP